MKLCINDTPTPTRLRNTNIISICPQKPSLMSGFYRSTKHTIRNKRHYYQCGYVAAWVGGGLFSRVTLLSRKWRVCDTVWHAVTFPIKRESSAFSSVSSTATGSESHWFERLDVRPQFHTAGGNWTRDLFVTTSTPATNMGISCFILWAHVRY